LAAQAILGYLTPCIQITGYPAAEAQSTASTHPAAEKTTHVARLGEEALLWGAIQPRTRSILRKAESAGLRAWGRNCVEEIQQAEALYRQACERWEGIATVPASFFDTLVGVPCEQARVWLAGQDEPVSMAVILYGKNEVQYFLGANGPEAAALHSAKWLLWHIMTDAAQRGFRWFNFGASGGLEGVAQFKRHLGGTPIQYSQTSYWHPLWQRIKG
jgi:lipid II:glycine glycyltransferase (peptidoglycan interpeptide bridge formation enzyme)